MEAIQEDLQKSLLPSFTQQLVMKHTLYYKPSLAADFEKYLADRLDVTGKNV